MTQPFNNITRNKGFVKVIALIVVVQVAMIYLGGAVLRCYGLNVSEWTVVLFMAVLIIPVDLLRKIIIRMLASGKNSKDITNPSKYKEIC